MKLKQIINELNFLPQGRFHGSFVENIPFTDVVNGKRVKATVLAAITYTWENGEIDIQSYDALQIVPKDNVIPALLQHAAMRAIWKKIENGYIGKSALTHFQNVNKTGPKAAKAFNRPRKR